MFFNYLIYSGLLALIATTSNQVTPYTMNFLKKRLLNSSLILSIIVCGLLATSFTWAGPAKNIYGRIEYITLEQNPTLLKAKMDTGARISSLSAVNLKYFEKHGEQWVAFDVIDPKRKIKIHFKKPLERMLHIKPRSDEHDSLTEPTTDKKESNANRPVIKMNICLRNQLKEIEVNLIDRSHFLYPMLLGSKSIVLFNGLINPATKFTERPSCNPVLNTLEKAAK